MAAETSVGGGSDGKFYGCVGYSYIAAGRVKPGMKRKESSIYRFREMRRRNEIQMQFV
jgi:hypothetical protein